MLGFEISPTLYAELTALVTVIIIDLMFTGGLLLLWVSWKLWRELRRGAHHDNTMATHAVSNTMPAAPATAGSTAVAASPKTFTQALTQIVVADVSMSLDNVLAVAGT